jgi:cytochrome c55X
VVLSGLRGKAGTGGIQQHPYAPAIFAGLMLFSLSAQPADGGDGARERPPAPARQLELQHMVRHDCGSCHGLTLAGGLGPALSARALESKPVEYVEAMILRGRPGTAMPAWRGLLSEDEARWIAQQLKRGFAQ